LVIESIAGYLRAGEGFNPAETEVRQRQQREEATARVEAALNPLARRYFRWNLNRTHYFVRMRDNGQHYIVKLALPMRRLFATLAERWAQRGWLAQTDHFFFLVAPEIETVLQTGSPAAAGLDLDAIATERRKAYDFWFGITIPEVLGPDGQPLAETAPADGTSLAGLAASGGKVTGMARVIMTPREATQLQPGEILVTRATDPGWTPVFSVIGGLVLEVGGQLSHGAIVAREYGLPTVVNVPEATRRIQDGQTITVDGSAGRVYLT
jgi:rifampicin phosphotransferase